jgi:hypothetical protein
MKIVGGFFLGIFVCLLVVAAVGYFTSSARAADAPADDLGLSGLLPDVGKIYREALGGPYRQVETEITDPDIARYYHSLMEKTGLDRIGAD